MTFTRAFDAIEGNVGKCYYYELEHPEGKARLARAIEDNWGRIAAAVRSAGGAFMGDEEAPCP